MESKGFLKGVQTAPMNTQAPKDSAQRKSGETGIRTSRRRWKPTPKSPPKEDLFLIPRPKGVVEHAVVSS